MSLARACWWRAVVLVTAVGCAKAPDPLPNTPVADAPPPSPKTSPVVAVSPPVTQAKPIPQGVPDAFGDAMPYGALFRLGTERGKPPRGWNARLLPTADRVLAAHSLQEVHSYRYFTLYDIGLKPTGPSVLAEGPSSGGTGSIVAVSADGKRCVTRNLDHYDVYDLATGKRLLHTPAARGYLSASLSADGTRLALGGSCKATPGDSPVVCTVWDVDAGKEYGRVTVLQNSDAGVALSPDAKTLITSGSHVDLKAAGKDDYPDKFTQIWDVESKAELARVKWPQSRQVEFSPDSKTVAVGTVFPASLMLCDARTGKTRHTVDVKATGVGPLAFRRDSQELATTSAGKTVRWNVATGERLGESPSPADLPPGVLASSIAYDARGRLLAFGDRRLAAFTWDVTAGKVLSPTGGGHGAPIRTMAYTSDGAEILTAGADGFIHRWAADTGKPLGVIEVPAIASNDIRLVGGGKSVVVDQTFRVLDGSKPPVAFSELTKTPVGTLSGSFPVADGSHVCVFGPNREEKPSWCKVVDVTASKVVSEVPLPAKFVRASAALSKDRKRLVTAHTNPIVNNSNDLVVTGWEVASGKKLGEYSLSKGGAVAGLGLLDDRRAVFGTGNGMVQIIDLETGKLVLDVPDPTRLACRALTVSPDGSRFAVAHEAKHPARYSDAVRIFDASTGAALHTLAGKPASFTQPREMFADTLTYMQQTMPSETMAFSPDGSRLAVPTLTSVLVFDLTKIGPDGGPK
jgi:WD40 repeat protein